MPGASRQHVVSRLISYLALLVFSISAHAQIHFDLPSQPLARSLITVANLGNVNLLYDPNLVDGLRAPALKAEVSADEALSRLLTGTGLRAVRADGNTVRVIVAAQADHPASARPSGTGSTYVQTPLRLAAAGAAADGASSGADSYPGEGHDNGRSSQNNELAQVIVSAEKRDERLQDVPVPVSAISAETLIETNQLRLQDYYSSVPGLNLATDNRGAPSVSIRGVATGAYVTPTVGITIDDVPFGSSVVASAYSPAPDVDPNEISRVEVLRGPQGTLYGASSIGGLIKYVTIDPSTDALKGRLQVGSDFIQSGSGAGYNASGAINIPITDTFALRANGFFHKEPGYVDNIESGRNNVNDTKAYGGRLSGLWRPSDDFSVKVSALLQRSKADGSSQVEVGTGLGDLQQRYLGGIGGYDRKIQAYSANLKAKFGDAELTSITGYGRSTVSDSFDVTSLLGGLSNALYGIGGDAWVEDNTTKKISQEIRLAMPLGSHVDWLFGLFYTHEKTNPTGGFLGVDPITFEPQEQLELQHIEQTYAEYAAFTDVTFHITDRFDVQLGGREGHNKQTYNITTTGPLTLIFLGAVSPVVAPEADSSDNSFTYLVTPRFRITPDLMAYARFASGYRPGGPNDTQDPIAPHEFAPDKTQNYEIGAKGDFLNHRLSFDTSVYYISWRDIQLSLSDPQTGIGYTGNASRARSKGAELSVEARPLMGMTVSSWVVLNDAVLTERLPPGFPGIAAVAAAGDRLPYSSRFSANLSLEQRFPLWGSADGYVGGSVSYVGERQGEFATTPQRQIYPAYARTDLRTGVRFDSWTAGLFVTNLTDRRGVLAGGLGTAYPTAFNYIQPRMAGLNISCDF